MTFEGGEPEQNQYLTILAVAQEFTVTGIVVKGGDGYNVYLPGARELPSDPRWRDLNAPPVGSDNVPEISHWFVCATKTPPMTTTTTTESTTTTSEETTTSPPSTTTTTAPTTTMTTTEPTITTTTEPTITTTTEPTTTTKSAAPVVVTSTSVSPALPVTGFATVPFVWIGVLLALGGGLLMLIARGRIHS